MTRNHTFCFSPFLPRKASSRLPKTPEELRCIIAIIRHGDRTPKQKMKMVVTYPHILAYYERHSSKPGSVSVLLPSTIATSFWNNTHPDVTTTTTLYNLWVFNKQKSSVRT